MYAVLLRFAVCRRIAAAVLFTRYTFTVPAAAAATRLVVVLLNIVATRFEFDNTSAL